MKQTTFLLMTIVFAAGFLLGKEPVTTVPQIHWDFETLQPESTLDKAGGISDTISGSYTRVKGVSGDAVRLDGYTFCLSRTGKRVPSIGASFSVDAWLAQAAYPWSWAPVLTQLKEGVSGFYFAVGPRGQFCLDLTINDEVYRCVSDDFVLPLNEWSHIAAVVTEGEGIQLLLNGRPAGSTPLKKAFRQVRGTEMRVGMNYRAVKPSNQIGDSGNLPFWYSLDGIIDEVRLFGEAVPIEQLGAYVKQIGKTSKPDLPPRKMPTGPEGDFGFGAFYTKLKYYPEWDNLWPVGDDPDVVVTFGRSPVRVVFWRGTRYSPAWISETGLWMADQSVEAWNGEEGCFEHMQDSKCSYSHVRIIENTPARVVVHWRYAPVSAYNNHWRVNEKTGWGVWVDEYYYIYPDTTGIRKVNWNTGALGRPRQFQESLPLTSPGQKRGDYMEKKWLMVANLAGETQTFEYVADPPAKNSKPIPNKPNIQRHNFTSSFDPFIIFEPGNRMNYLKDRDIRNLDKYGSCNHWPVCQAHCDGRVAQTGDRPTHFLGFPISSPVIHSENGRNYWAGLYGMTDQPIARLVQLSRSWNRPPAVTVRTGKVKYKGYNTGERAFDFSASAAGNETVSWEWQASADSPLVCPAVIIEGIGKQASAVLLNGKRLINGRDYEVGVVKRLEGDYVVLWFDISARKPTSVELKF